MSKLTESRYSQLKREVEEAQSRANRARGALEETIATLKEEFGVENLKEAKKKLAELETKASVAELKFSDAVKKYEEEWKADEDASED